MRTGLALLAALAGAGGATAEGRSALRRDAEGYAVAACLREQDDAYLREQGERWAGIIVRGRARGELEPWAELAAAVRAATRPADAYRLAPDRPGDPARTAPVAYCAEIVDAPPVRAAVKRAMRRLRPAYRAGRGRAER